MGGAASRIIAEGVSIDIDIDTMLRRDGFKFTRFVDDFRIIVDSPAHAHTALCRLAEHLMITEGLSLNASKTRISLASKKNEIDNSFSEVFTTEERHGLDRYLQSIYDDEDVAETLADQIDEATLIKKLALIVSSDKIDYTSVKLILKAMRATSIADIDEFIKQFSKL